MKYIVQWDYSSSQGGPWLKGDAVELADEELVAAINRSSPNVLKPEVQKRQVKRAPKDRQVKSASSRKVKS